MMPMPQQPYPPPITPATATANRALQLTFYRTTGNSQQQAEALRIGAMVCWDAVMDVAHNAGGIQNRVNILSFQFNQMFPTFPPSPVVPNAQAAISLPAGCLVGFIDPQGTRLAHVMIHVGVGWAASTNNGSMFPAQPGGIWQLINLTSFFGSMAQTHRNIRMVYRIINGTGL
jgi:hypothetical protein